MATEFQVFSEGLQTVWTLVLKQYRCYFKFDILSCNFIPLCLLIKKKCVFNLEMNFTFKNYSYRKKMKFCVFYTRLYSYQSFFFSLQQRFLLYFSDVIYVLLPWTNISYSIVTYCGEKPSIQMKSTIKYFIYME